MGLLDIVVNTAGNEGHKGSSKPENVVTTHELGIHCKSTTSAERSSEEHSVPCLKLMGLSIPRSNKGESNSMVSRR